jgi:hypothetical protein
MRKSGEVILVGPTKHSKMWICTGRDCVPAGGDDKGKK